MGSVVYWHSSFQEILTYCCNLDAKVFDQRVVGGTVKFLQGNTGIKNALHVVLILIRDSDFYIFAAGL